VLDHEDEEEAPRLKDPVDGEPAPTTVLQRIELFRKQERLQKKNEARQQSQTPAPAARETKHPTPDMAVVSDGIVRDVVNDDTGKMSSEEKEMNQCIADIFDTGLKENKFTFRMDEGRRSIERKGECVSFDELSAEEQLVMIQIATGVINNRNSDIAGEVFAYGREIQIDEVSLWTWAGYMFSFVYGKHLYTTVSSSESSVSSISSRVPTGKNNDDAIVLGSSDSSKEY
jgi:hypothetical protein